MFLPWQREILNPVALRLTRVGFEPTPPERLVPKTSALDRSAISPRICHSNRLNAPIKLPSVGTRNSESCVAWFDEIGIRTHASEETGPLNQRLRPLGRLAEILSSGASFDESGIRTHASKETFALNQRLRPLGHLAKDIVALRLTIAGFEHTPPKRLVPKTTAMDRSAISPRKPLSYRFNGPVEESHDFKNMNCVGTRNSKSNGAWSDESGIGTHASQETGALNQRLRPLGHLAKDISQQPP
ncbi:unnamed protein product [Toxocara canis]|uniref:Uncharacterized protein n=1 Tax=Toxocara canis TaxID=6265 RepID=A0A183UWT0_TOXCA|nr:unnamed protein product [Toxocara canis]